MGQLPHNKANAILSAAVQGNYAVPAVCVYNLEAALATLRAAEHKRSPAMLLLFPWALDYASSHLPTLCASICHSASVPISLHLDHAQTPSIVRRAADLPAFPSSSSSSRPAFDSIMVDMSHHSKDENLRLTQELTTYCHERGIATEAEPGRIEGGEDGVAETVDLEGVLTTPEEAQRFVDTGIDWLAPAFGNVHGSYGARGVRLEYELLERINERVGGVEGVRLVAHGTDPFDKEVYGRLRERGVSKVNINGVVNRRYLDVQREAKGGLTAVMEEGTRRMQDEVERLMDELGSSGRV